ncbi:MAG: efflux RND transporter periplasmic adaptor subunit, partial [Acidobacteria bacterium]|nr:efflux RND transporter periplasmic adaptor subunit [Acidobacteriota bacterium]
MKMPPRPFLHFFGALMLAIPLVFAVSCTDQNKPAPTKTQVELEPGTYELQHPEMFKLVQVSARNLPIEFNANGAVTADVNSTIHVTSQASGRVVDLGVRLGDYVHKGQRLLSIYSADLTSSFSDYEKAVADERISKKALDRAELLYARGAFAAKDLEQAQVS